MSGTPLTLIPEPFDKVSGQENRTDLKDMLSLTCRSMTPYLSVQTPSVRGVQSDALPLEEKPISILSRETQSNSAASRVSFNVDICNKLSRRTVFSNSGNNILSTKAQAGYQENRGFIIVVKDVCSKVRMFSEVDRDDVYL